MFAVIKWVEDGKFSILPTEHIRDFDEDEYFAGMEEKDVYLVEWRQGVDEPKGGWPVYERIIKIAGARSVARKETLDVHQKNWVCHIYCQINAQKKNKKTSMLIGY